jgi:hypothetical protein
LCWQRFHACNYLSWQMYKCLTFTCMHGCFVFLNAAFIDIRVF